MISDPICTICGGQLESVGENKYRCIYCRTGYHEDTVKKETEALAELLNQKDREMLSNLRQQLWKKVNETYNDSEEVLRLSREIKNYKPDDFFANFYEAANLDTEEQFVSFLENINVENYYSVIGTVLNYAIKSITPKNMLAICNLIERAYKQNDLSLYNEFRTKYDEQCKKINDCVYDPAFPRDAFICYSSKDMDKVEELVKFLEEQGLSCFVAIRNLQHGRGAVQNYWNALHTAIENCKCIVFLSSTHSRDMHCDALQELRYVLSLEQKLGKKIKKIELLLENYTGALVEKNFKRIFEGLEYCYDFETVFDRITMEDEDLTPVAAPPVLMVEKEVKFCLNCGREILDSAKFCPNCGKDEFVATQEEYIEHLRRAAADAESARIHAESEARIRAEAEARVRAEAEIEARVRAETEARLRAEAGRQPSYYNDTPPANNRKSAQYDAPANYANNGGHANRHAHHDGNEFYSGHDFTEICKGQRVALPENVRKARVTVETTYKLDNVSADLYVFMLNNQERVLSESDLVFFGNDSSLNNSVKLQSANNSDTVDISFFKVNQDITTLRFILSMSIENGRANFSMMRNSTVKVYLEDQAFQLNIEDVGRVKSICVVDFYRIRDRWKLNVQSAGLPEDIATLCGNYGIDVG